ncbi:netrin receptor UNC5B-a-like [Dreissena polymorpha]|uniref:Uncharacterized protein n=1 Tax=Dreissena polymorpha TaxID=45954 RepID=A0A9D4F7P7_DREPO|nr:netrin receptor UNC5B-a-like [Dreissena polymorpha]XP_052222696.1 netrin receptor UNC5B-a-like [Dreissena polymorpha]XP_052222697.1 netrin receptor UNC5B-a-like [Dreissena polymorpha]XP_052222698.1 netrin receptor UNC5B-a-like [Dreissena polymorpha]KAH3791606.1 hypothetical protein DPMN_145095 [Dreissena polymorpha]
MYGTSTGRLDVYQASGPFVPGHLMWSLKGDQGNSWFQAQIALESVQNYSIIIVGFVGNGYLGDIAVDDVSLSDGYCDVIPPSASRSEVSNSTLARVDGEWHAWLHWATCDVTCGAGTQLRTRECYFPPRATKGNACQGIASESRTCHNEICHVCPETTTNKAPAETATVCSIVQNVFCSKLDSISCTGGLNFICGSDGNFYPNECEISKAMCHDATLTILTNITKCQANVGGYLASTTTKAPATTDTMCSIVQNVFCNYSDSILCNTGFNVLCGSDGTYYPNPCEISKARCHDATLTILTNITKCRANVGGNLATTTTKAPATTDTMCPIVQNLFCNNVDSISCVRGLDNICGSDGQYYPNQCEVSKAWCHDATLTILTNITKCQANVG